MLRDAPRRESFARQLGHPTPDVGLAHLLPGRVIGQQHEQLQRLRIAGQGGRRIATLGTQALQPVTHFLAQRDRDVPRVGVNGDRSVGVLVDGAGRRIRIGRAAGDSFSTCVIALAS